MTIDPKCVICGFRRTPTNTGTPAVCEVCSQTRTRDSLRTNQRNQPVIRELGCVVCQTYHREGIDAEYELHLMYQSKHGTSERVATPDEVLAIVRGGINA